MKKRVAATALVMCLLSLTTAQCASQLSWKLIPSAKQVLTCLASGDYDDACGLLPFSDDAPDADDWERFAGEFSSLKKVQRDYAVAYWKDGWRIAVPVKPPEDGGVETLLLTSANGKTIDGVKRVNWSRVEKEYSASDKVVWDQEYVGDTPRVYN